MQASAAQGGARAGLEVATVTGDPLADALDLGEIEVVLAADVLYADATPTKVWTWLSAEARRGKRVLVSDPGRLPKPLPGMVERWQTRGPDGSSCAVYEVDVVDAVDVGDAGAAPVVDPRGEEEGSAGG